MAGVVSHKWLYGAWPGVGMVLQAWLCMGMWLGVGMVFPRHGLMGAWLHGAWQPEQSLSLG